MRSGLLAAVVVTGALGAAGAPGAAATVPRQVYGLTVSVTEAGGRPVAGLTSADFAVRVGDRDVNVIGAEPDPRPVSVVLIIDGAEAEEALHARAALRTALTRLRAVPGTRVGLMLGERGAQAPDLRDANEAAAEHDRRVSRFFRAEVTAPPEDLLAGAAEALAREEARRRVVLILSVNRRPPQGQIPQDLIPALRRADVLVGALEVSSGRIGAGLDPALRLIQSAVGGRFERVPDITALDAAAGRLASRLMSAYLVTFVTTDPPSGPVAVAVRDRPRLVVLAPTWALR